MSNDRDIDDILDSLNQLLREGESHNDDHVETDGQIDGQIDDHVDQQAEEIEAELHELEEDDAAPEEVEPERLETHVDSSSEASDAEREDLQEAPTSVQRVVLTEDMLVNNPQGNLLSMVKGDEVTDVESVAEPEAEEFIREELSESEELPEQEAVLKSASENHDSNIVGFLSEELLEQLVESVSDDVISQLQQQLPTLIKTALDCHLSKLRDEKQSENHSEE